MYSLFERWLHSVNFPPQSTSPDQAIFGSVEQAEMGGACRQTSDVGEKSPPNEPFEVPQRIVSSRPARSRAAFAHFFQQDRFTDCDIRVGNSIYNCHIIVLASFSPYFGALLEGQTSWLTLNISVPNPVVFDDLLRFIYRGEVFSHYPLQVYQLGQALRVVGIYDENAEDVSADPYQVTIHQSTRADHINNTDLMGDMTEPSQPSEPEAEQEDDQEDEPEEPKQVQKKTTKTNLLDSILEKKEASMAHEASTSGASTSGASNIQETAPARHQPQQSWSQVSPPAPLTGSARRKKGIQCKRILPPAEKVDAAARIERIPSKGKSKVKSKGAPNNISSPSLNCSGASTSTNTNGPEPNGWNLFSQALQNIKQGQEAKGWDKFASGSEKPKKRERDSYSDGESDQDDGCGGLLQVAMAVSRDEYLKPKKESSDETTEEEAQGLIPSTSYQGQRPPSPGSDDPESPVRQRQSLISNRVMLEVPVIPNEPHFIYDSNPSKLSGYVKQVQYWLRVMPDTHETLPSLEFLHAAYQFLTEIRQQGYSPTFPDGLVPPPMPEFAIQLTMPELEPNFFKRKNKTKPKAPKPTVARDDNGDPMLNKNGKPMVKCEKCGKILADASSLYRHRRIHNKEKSHRCFLCGKTFIQRFNMKQHTRTHQVDWAPPEIVVSMPRDLRRAYLGLDKDDPEETEKRVARKQKAIGVSKAKSNAPKRTKAKPPKIPKLEHPGGAQFNPMVLPPPMPFQFPNHSHVQPPPPVPLPPVTMFNPMVSSITQANLISQANMMNQASMISQAKMMSQANLMTQAARHSASIPPFPLGNHSFAPPSQPGPSRDPGNGVYPILAQHLRLLQLAQIATNSHPEQQNGMFQHHALEHAMAQQRHLPGPSPSHLGHIEDETTETDEEDLGEEEEEIDTEY